VVQNNTTPSHVNPEGVQSECLAVCAENSICLVKVVHEVDQSG
jgi:hypothetical protein